MCHVRRNRSWAVLAAGALLAVLLSSINLPETNGRVGGGRSYSSGRSSSRSSSSRSSSRSYSSGSRSGYSGGGDAGPLLYFLFTTPIIGVPLLILIVFLIIRSSRAKTNTARPYSSRTAISHGYSGSTAAVQEPEAFQATPAQISERLDQLRKFDANFSEILFTDFIYTLYARVHEARGRGDLENFTSYLDRRIIGRLQALGGPQLADVTGIIIAASQIINVSDPSQPTITITVSFETNYTEIHNAGTTTATSGKDGNVNTWYAREEWKFTRRRDILSRPPEKITALHCPKCGGPLEKRPDGSCNYCGVIIVGGDFDWFVIDMRILERMSQGPLLTADVPERGTELPSVVHPNLQQQYLQLGNEFSWPQAEERIRHIFNELQAAWSNQQWERARPYETDNLFQTHLFWITEYQRQRLREVLENIQIERIQPIKITTDAFYEGITVRIFAHMIDYTVDSAGNVVSGDPKRPRRFSEYWTFIRRRGVKTNNIANSACPNCAAPLEISMAGVCHYCGGKVTSGEFDWVLSRIEQDESYGG